MSWKTRGIVIHDDGSAHCLPRGPTLARRARDTSAAMSARSAAAVDNRSSQSAIGRSVKRARLRAKARVDCARGPSLPSMLTGSPSTKPAALRSEATARRRAASAANFLRLTVSTAVAMRRSGSLVATPIVLLPRSRPISAPRRGKCAAASTSGRIKAATRKGGNMGESRRPMQDRRNAAQPSPRSNKAEVAARAMATTPGKEAAERGG